MMLKCTGCGFENPDGMRFCGQCGNGLMRTCPHCNATIPVNFTYCGMCGMRLPELSRIALGKGEFNGKGTMQAAVREDTKAEKPYLEGERRRATVMLADVRDSTGLLEKLGSETWVEIMNQVFHLLEAEIYRMGGVVDQFRGDGLVAFFGTIHAHEDDPERAVLAGLAMQKVMAGYSEKISNAKGYELRLRVGINTGEVIVTSVGERSQHREDTAMGEAVALAARMETAAEPGTVLVSENTYQLIKSRFRWMELGKIYVKGVTEPVGTYRPLEHISEIVEAEDEALLPPTTGLVGRVNEVNQLKNAIEELGRGRGRIVLLTGDKGMGKSYLVNHVRQQFQWVNLRGGTSLQRERKQHGDPMKESRLDDGKRQGLMYLWGECYSYNQERPYSIWREILLRWLELSGQEVKKEETHTRLTERAKDLWDTQADQYIPYLATILDIPLSEEETLKVKFPSAEGLQNQIYLAIWEWLRKVAKKFPLVLTFSDMHWVDTSSLSLLENCLPLCETEPILFLVAYTAERTSPIWRFQHLVETVYPHRMTAVELPPLAEDDVRSMVEMLLGKGALQPATMDLLVKKAEGNPYFIQQMVQSLVDNGVLVFDNDSNQWREMRPVGNLDLPESLHHLITARMDRLSAADRRILQMAAVIGRTFWKGILQMMVEDPEQLDVSLAHLQRVQMIQEHDRLPDLGIEYTFRSSLIRDVAYESLLSTQRLNYHQQIARRLEDLVAPEDQPRYDGLIAYHYRRAGAKNKELFYTLQAANQARTIYANQEALENYLRAEEILREMEKETTNEERLYAIRGELFELINGRWQVYQSMGRLDEARADARTMLELANLMNDDPAWKLEALLAQPETFSPRDLGEIRAGKQMAEEARELAKQLNDHQHEVLAVTRMASLHYLLHLDWEPLAEEALNLAREVGDLVLEVELLMGISNAYGMDNLKRSQEYLEAALYKAQLVNDKSVELNLLSAIGPSYERTGDYYRFLVEYEEKRLALAREMGYRMVEGQAVMFCGQIKAMYLGDYENGLVLLKEAYRIWEHVPDRLFPLLRIVQTHTEMGNLEEAQSVLAQAVPDYEHVLQDLGRAGFHLVSSIWHNRVGTWEDFHQVLEHVRMINEMAARNQVSRQYLIAARCEATAAHLGLAQLEKDEARAAEHRQQALQCSSEGIEIFNQFGFIQVIECTSEELFYRHHLALLEDEQPVVADQWLEKAYQEMMRKYELIPEDSEFRKTFLKNIRLHKQITNAYKAKNKIRVEL